VSKGDMLKPFVTSSARISPSLTGGLVHFGLTADLN
jgi:hypothetical protein